MREVVRLGAAGREDDLARLGVEARGDPLVGLVERGPGLPTEGVRRRRVAELLGQERQHRVERLAAERRRGGVIEVDRHGSRLYAACRPVRSARRNDMPLKDRARSTPSTATRAQAVALDTLGRAAEQLSALAAGERLS